MSNLTQFLYKSGVPIAAAAGTVDAITVTYAPAIALADQLMVAFVSTGANTITTPTFAPNGLTARTIVKRGGVALVAGDIAASLSISLLEYNSANTRWELLNPALPPNTAVTPGAYTVTSLTVDAQGRLTAASSGTVSLPRNYIGGLGIASAADVTNDITIAVGEARDETDAQDITLASALTKQIDAAWAVGTNAGGMDTGTVASSTSYYIWLILRSDTSVVDALFSLSGTAPTMPTNYDYRRLIAFVRRNGSAAIQPFENQGDVTWYVDGIGDVSDATITNNAFETGTLSCPRHCLAFITAGVSNTTSTNPYSTMYVRAVASVAAVANAQGINSINMGGTTFDYLYGRATIKVDGSSQVEYAVNEATGDATAEIATMGFSMSTRRDP